MNATIIFCEKIKVSFGDFVTETFREEQRVELTDLKGPPLRTALAWARNYRKPWQTFVIIIDGRVEAME